MEINIVNDSQYQFLMDELGIRRGVNTWNEFQVQEDNTIVIGEKKIAFEILANNANDSSDDNSITNFFRIVGIKHEKNLVSISLSTYEGEALISETPTEG